MWGSDLPLPLKFRHQTSYSLESQWFVWIQSHKRLTSHRFFLTSITQKTEKYLPAADPDVVLPFWGRVAET